MIANVAQIPQVEAYIKAKNAYKGVVSGIENVLIPQLSNDSIAPIVKVSLGTNSARKGTWQSIFMPVFLESTETVRFKNAQRNTIINAYFKNGVTQENLPTLIKLVEASTKVYKENRAKINEAILETVKHDTPKTEVVTALDTVLSTGVSTSQTVVADGTMVAQNILTDADKAFQGATSTLEGGADAIIDVASTMTTDVVKEAQKMERSKYIKYAVVGVGILLGLLFVRKLLK